MGPAVGTFQYSEVVHAPLGVSWQATAALVTAGALTLLVVAFTPLGPLPRALAAAAVVAGTLLALRSIAHRRGSNAVRHLVLDRTGAMGVRDGSGRWRSGQARSGSFVAPWLTIVRWRPEGHRLDRTILILPDMIAPEEFRRLRVLLRWGQV